MSRSRVRVFAAVSLDGFIAGPGDDLSWLPEPSPEETDEAGDGGALTWEEFMNDVGALLMGRRTWDVVQGFHVPWPWGDRPVLVATTRPLDADGPHLVRPVRGDVETLVEEARAAAGGGDVYLDGGDLIRQAAAADLLDEVVLTVAPVALGRGVPLFAGLERPCLLDMVSHHSSPGGMVQLRMRRRSG